MKPERPFLWFPVGLGLGISLYFSLQPLGYLVYSLCCLIGLISLLIRHFVVIGLFTVSLGFSLIQFKISGINTQMLEKPIKKATIQGVVQALEDHAKKQYLCRVLIKDSSNQSILKLTAKHALCQDLCIGDKIIGLADLLPFSYPVSLTSQDWRRYHYLLGISSTGRLLEIKSKDHPLLKPIDRLHFLRDRLTQLLKVKLQGEEGQIAAALITGDRSGIPSKIRQNFADSGIAHILAISGLHVSLVVGIIFFALRRIMSCLPYVALRYPIKTWASIVSLIASFLYIAISGFGYPSIRAFLMASMILLGMIMGRKPISMRSVALAASFILVIYPESLLSVSFQLSFAAVVALIAGYEGLYPYISLYPKWARVCIGLFMTTILATLATTPLVLDVFQRMTIQSVLGNLLAIPLTSFWIMPIAVCCLFSLLWGGNEFIFALWKWGLQFLILIAEKVASLPGAAITVQKPFALFLPLCVLGGLLICLLRNRIRWVGLVPLFIGVCVLFFDRTFPDVYVAGDGSVIAYQKGSTLFISSLRSKFYYEEWSKEANIKRIERWQTSIIDFPPYRLIANPWKARPYKTSQVITNGYYKGNAIIDKKILNERGSCFLIKNTVQCVKDKKSKHPWG